MAVYAAQVDRMDAGIGRIMAALRESGVEQDTLVLFLSDNGGCAELLREDGQRAREWPITREGKPMRFGNIAGLMPGDATTYQSYDLPWANASNTPFRLYKHWVHEGGIATPLIASWPRRIRAAAIEHEPLHLVDLMATCLDVVGASYPDEYQGRPILPLEGQSFASLLYGQRWQREGAICWEHEGNRAVRAGQWKLVSMHPGRWELYDMSRDGTEGRDLSDRYGDTVKAIGYSGHHLGIAVDIAAVALGATWLERHFTLDRTWKGTDHPASLEPDGLRRLVRDVRAVNRALSTKPAAILDIEQPQRQKLKRPAAVPNER